MIQLPNDFSEFLKSLDENGVRYLLVGGYAVSFYGYARSTGDLDIWIPRDYDTASRLVSAIRNFGFDQSELAPELLLAENAIIRMGRPPLQIEVLTSIDGVDFEQYCQNRIVERVRDVHASFISLPDLRTNKSASVWPKDLEDLQRLSDER